MSTKRDTSKGRGAREVGDLSRALARKAKGLRAEKGWSQEELSRRANIPYATYRKIEAGATVFDVEQQARVAIALGIDPDDMYELALVQARADAEDQTAGDESDEARYRRLLWVPLGELTASDRTFIQRVLAGEPKGSNVARLDAKRAEKAADAIHAADAAGDDPRAKRLADAADSSPMDRELEDQPGVDDEDYPDAPSPEDPA